MSGAQATRRGLALGSRPRRSRRLSFWRSRRTMEAVMRVAATLIVIACSAIIIAPALWMVSTSLKTRPETIIFPPRLLPEAPQWGNYPEALTFLPFARYFRNTATIVLVVMLGDVLSNSVIAYAFARLRAPGRELLFTLVLSTMMVPYQVLMIPQYVLFHRLGWIDTYKPLTVPAWFGSAFLIFLLRQFYRAIPQEMDDAARIDGCGYISTLVRILLPLSKPAISCAAIFSFTYNWNDFLAPLIYINSQDKLTVAVGLSYFTHRYGATPWNLLMAASITTVMPCVLLFFFAQKYFIQGIVISGVKG